MSYARTKLNIDDNLYNDVSISSDGLTLVAGVPSINQAYVYKYSNYNWGSGTALNTDSLGGLFGWSVSINANGSTILVGAPTDSGRGNVYIYTLQPNNSWSLTSTVSFDSRSRNGYSVSISKGIPCNSYASYGTGSVTTLPFNFGSWGGDVNMGYCTTTNGSLVLQRTISNSAYGILYAYITYNSTGLSRKTGGLPFTSPLSTSTTKSIAISSGSQSGIIVNESRIYTYTYVNPVGTGYSSYTISTAVSLVGGGVTASVATSDDGTVVVTGAPTTLLNALTNAGNVFVYTNSAWSSTPVALNNNPIAGERFGTSVAVMYTSSIPTVLKVVVASTTSVYVYSKLQYYDIITPQSLTYTLQNQISLMPTLQTESKYYGFPPIQSGNLLFFKDYNSTGNGYPLLNLQPTTETSLERGWSAFYIGIRKTCSVVVPYNNIYYVLSVSPLTRDGISISNPSSATPTRIMRSQFILLTNSTETYYSLSSTNYRSGSIIIIKNISGNPQNIISDVSFIDNTQTVTFGFKIPANRCYIVGRGPSNFFFISVADFTYSTLTFSGTDCSTVLSFIATPTSYTNTGTLIKGINIITSQPASTRAYYTLPALKSEDSGSLIIIKDGGGNAASANPITIVPPTGYAIESTANSLNLISPYSAVWLMYNFLTDSDNKITTVVGYTNGGTTAPNAGYGGDGQLATSSTVRLFNPTGIARDSVGNIYIADFNNNLIRMVAGVDVQGKYTKGYIYTIAGYTNGGTQAGIRGYGGDGQLATSSTVYLNLPWSVATDSVGNIYISDNGNNLIRMIAGIDVQGKYTKGYIYTIAGATLDAGYGGDGQLATSSTVQLSTPRTISLDSVGNIYIADAKNNLIRMVAGVDVQGKYTKGYIYTIAGYTNGGTQAGAAGYGGDGQLATSSTVKLNEPWGVATDSVGNIYIADFNNNLIRMVAGVDVQGKYTKGYIYTIAGYTNGGTQAGAAGYGGDGQLATSFGVKLNFPRTISLDSVGNIYISDGNNNLIRMVAGVDVQGKYTKGYIYTVVGYTAGGTTAPNAGYGGDGQLATSSTVKLNNPRTVLFDSMGNIYIADVGNYVIRKVSINIPLNYSIVNYCTTN